MNLLKGLFGSSGSVISAKDAKTRIDTEKALFILDVRQPDEFRDGHIGGAKLIPLNELPTRIDELPKDREIICVCRSGARSSAAVGQLGRAGYTAINLQGGMIAWQQAGLPIKKGK